MKYVHTFRCDIVIVSDNENPTDEDRVKAFEKIKKEFTPSLLDHTETEKDTGIW